MKKQISSIALTLTLLAGTLPARAGNDFGEKGEIKHVLLISIDGLHALDVARFVESHPDSALAELASHGITYSSARTPANSDSFPVFWRSLPVVRPFPMGSSTT